mgnify:CR=1 FL=1
MLLSLTALTAILVSSWSGAAALLPASAPVTITHDNIELNGAGEFRFKPDARAFTVQVPPGRSSVAFVDRVWFDSAGRPVACDIGATPLADVAQAGCAQLMRFARFEMLAGMDIPYRRGFVDVEFRFFAASSRSGAVREIHALPQPGYGNIVVNYPAIEVPASAILDPADGSLAMAITPQDYPSVALRAGLESASEVLIGIDRRGAVRSCRPIGTSVRRTSFLDNHTCGLMLRRARFQFSETSAQYEGLRYLSKKAFWTMPL